MIDMCLSGDGKDMFVNGDGVYGRYHSRNQI